MKKIVFAAIAGFTGEETKDRRVIAAPEGGRIRHREYPMPVRTIISGEIRQIGTIDMAAWCDRRILIFGHLDPALCPEFIVRGLDNGAYAFEIDLDDVEINMDEDDLSMRMTSWRLAAAMVGGSPCWKLPKVQIEEIEIKEKDHV